MVTVKRRSCRFGLLLTLLLRYSCRAQVAGQDSSASDHYTAAVVEFSPTHEPNDGPSTLRRNTDAYIGYIERAGEQNADIIVFPEDGLTSLFFPGTAPMDAWATVVPAAGDEYVPCTGRDRIGVSETLRRLSCAARDNRIYVVVNIAEKRFCEPAEDGCPTNGTRHHNTNVVFDRTGKVIARYRKANLYMEAQFDKTNTPEIVSFDTDFGVRFGTFVCFDILFSVPGLTLTRKHGISNVVFTTAWFSELPFLTAIQTQFGWSFAENVNLLAAGYHDPERGSAGSGIYLGRNGIANVTMSRDPADRLLISRVPKTPATPSNENKAGGWPWKSSGHVSREETTDAGRKQRGREPDDWIRLLHDRVETFRSVPLNASSMTRQTICYEKFCCDFDVRASTDDPRSTAIGYRAVVYDGVRFYGRAVEAGVRLCGVIRCSNDSISSCGTAAESAATFASLAITATFDDYSDTLTIPSVLDTSLVPIEGWTYDERPNGNGTNVRLALSEPAKNLVAFAIYSRDFTRDKWYRTVSRQPVPPAALA